MQLPYRLHVRSLRMGRALEVGCGIGRNLAHLPAGSVGVDHNPFSVQTCRSLGFEAYTDEEIREAIGQSRTHMGALRAFATVVEVHKERTAFAASEGWL